MRNLFDQYDQPENRVTHALASVLAADPRLLCGFVAWITDWKIPRGPVDILEQSLPGELAELPEDESERRGLPDACIVGPDGRALLIESKVAAKVSTDQLRRHLRTAERHGLSGCRLLLLTATPVALALPPLVVSRTWSEVYQWLVQQTPESEWAGTCARYLEIAEARGSAAGYFTEGTLTVFSGIPFDADTPYTYLQAKRILGLLRADLLRDPRLKRELGADPKSEGRGAITGRSAGVVWDFIGLKVKGIQRPEPFNKRPHLTLGISETALGISVTLPNAMPTSHRARVFGPDYPAFEKLIGEVTQRLMRALRRCPGANPHINVFQRHYLTQRSMPIIDSRLEFDPRTALPAGAARGRVKAQPQWLRATYDAITSRQSNLQFQIGATFPYAACPEVRSTRIRAVAVEVWLACRPIIAAAGGH
jgi:hypothetical protein